MRDRLRRALGRMPPPLALEAPAALLELAREGAVPLAPASDAAVGWPLHIAAVVPPFRRGSGGHSTIMHLLGGLEARGHTCSVWLEGDSGDDAAARFAEWFGAPSGGVAEGFGHWSGADFVLATGWQTAHRVLRLGGCGARAYLVQDHEPEFHGTSAERTWAEETYRLGIPCVAASPWLAGRLRERYGARAESFDLGVDHGVYHPQPGVTRRDDLVAVYARATTPRRAVPLALLAMEELSARRPGTEIVLFGEARPFALRFRARHAGVLDETELARLYSEAAVGLVLSTTNPSLVPTEMLACGLPVVDVASPAMVQSFGTSGAVELAPFDPLGLAGAVERLLDDPRLRAERSETGLAVAEERTWPRAAEQVESALRGFLAG